MKNSKFLIIKNKIYEKKYKLSSFLHRSLNQLKAYKGRTNNFLNKSINQLKAYKGRTNNFLNKSINQLKNYKAKSKNFLNNDGKISNFLNKNLNKLKTFYLEKFFKKEILEDPKFFEGLDNNFYFKNVYDSLHDLRNSFEYYKEFIQIIEINKKLKVVPLSEIDLVQNPSLNIVGLRHDIDNLPDVAVKASRHLARVGIVGSFYFLHTSPYYSQNYNGNIVRNPFLKEWIRKIALTGNEIGLHNDALGATLDWGYDGIQILKKEIEWIRSLGIPLKGTVAHNSAPIYGAENYEIFEEYRLFNEKNLQINKRDNFKLGVIKQEDLGLSYEGTFSNPRININCHEVVDFFNNNPEANICSKEWVFKWLYENPSCTYRIDAQCWLIGKDFWVICSYIDGYKTFEWGANLQKLKSWLYDVPIGKKIIFVIHPEYICGKSYD